MPSLQGYDIYIGDELRWDAAFVRYQVSPNISYLEVRHRASRNSPNEKVAFYATKDGYKVTEIERVQGRIVFQVEVDPRSKISRSAMEPFTVMAQKNAKAGGCGCSGRRQSLVAP